MVDVIQYLDVILPNSELESRGEEQDGVVSGWLKEVDSGRRGC